MLKVRKRKYKSGKEVWYADFIVRGKRYRPVLEANNKAQAIQMARKLQDDIINERYELSGKNQKITLRELSDKYIEFAKETKKSWDRDVVSLNNILSMLIGNVQFGDYDINTITSQQILQYQLERKRQLDQKFQNKYIDINDRNYASINRELACLKHMFYLAMEWGIMHKNPVVSKTIKFYKEKRRDRILSKEEIGSLLSEMNGHTYQITCIALNTGMRVGEILNLHREQLDIVNRVIHVKFTKTGVDRDIPINEFLLYVIKGIHINGEYVFLNLDTGKPITTIRKSWGNVIRRAEIKNFRFHDLRHTFSSYLAMAGIDEVTRAELLGHSKRTMTMTYSHSNWEQKKKAVEIMGEICHVYGTQVKNSRLSKS